MRAHSPPRVFFLVRSLSAFVLLIAANGERAPAQAPGFGAQAGTPANEIAEFKGKLKGARGGIVLVTKEDGTETMVAPPDNIMSFQFVAKATPAFLQRGMLVRFTGNFGPTGMPVSPISKVTLFQPVNLRMLEGRAKQQFAPGVYSDAKNADRRNMMTGKLTIVGQLIGLAPNGVLAVQAGKIPVRVPVNQNTVLEVRYNNLNLAQEGDPVSVSGFYQPPNVNQIKADRITITTDRVYGEYKPEADKKSRRKRGDEEDKEDKDDAASDEGKAGENPEDAGSSAETAAAAKEDS